MNFGRRQAASLKVLVSNLISRPNSERSYQSYRDIERIVLYRLYLYTHIYIYIYIYMGLIFEFYCTTFKITIQTYYFIQILYVYFFRIKKTTDSRSFPPNNPPFTHLRLGDWRRQPWRIWEKRVMDTSIQMFSYLYGCRYHLFYWVIYGCFYLKNHWTF